MFLDLEVVVLLILTLMLIHINISGASSNQILSWTGSDYAWVADQSNIAGISTTGTSYFNNINASGTVTASLALVVLRLP